jgi:hypothetical protein
MKSVTLQGMDEGKAATKKTVPTGTIVLVIMALPFLLLVFPSFKQSRIAYFKTEVLGTLKLAPKSEVLLLRKMHWVNLNGNYAPDSRIHLLRPEKPFAATEVNSSTMTTVLGGFTYYITATFYPTPQPKEFDDLAFKYELAKYQYYGKIDDTTKAYASGKEAAQAKQKLRGEYLKLPLDKRQRVDQYLTENAQLLKKFNSYAIFEYKGSFYSFVSEAQIAPFVQKFEMNRPND